MNRSKIYAIAVIVIIISVVIKLLPQIKVSTTQKVKVKSLQQQQLIKGTDGNLDTEIRYLVITDKETFVCENSLLNNKFNNSDIFFSLKVDSVYTFKVAGIGKTFFTDYRNILEIK